MQFSVTRTDPDADGFLGVDTPRQSLLPHLPTTLLFSLQFSLGWLLHRRPELLTEGRMNTA